MRITLPFDIRMGVSRKGSGFNSTDNAAVKAMRDRVLGAIVGISDSVVIARIEPLQEEIAVAIQTDLATFARLCIRFFFSQRASTVGADRVITLDETLDTGLPLAGEMVQRGATMDMTLFWPALSANTMKRKRRMGGPGVSTYFIYTDQLAFTMETAFGDMLASMFDPRFTITTVQDARKVAKGVFERGNKVASIKIRLFRNQNDAFVLRGALGGGDWSGADDLPIMTKYLGREIAEKLQGPGRGPIKKRPWVGPAIAFWVLSRAPVIVEEAVLKVMKPKKKRRYSGASLGD